MSSIRSFKISKYVIVMVNLITIVSLIIYGWNIKLEAKDLKDLAQLIMIVILFFGAIGVAIVAIPFDFITNSKINKKEFLVRYVEEMGILLSITLLGYVLSIVGTNLQEWIIKLYSISMLLLLVNIITRTCISIIAHFNAKDKKIIL